MRKVAQSSGANCVSARHRHETPMQIDSEARTGRFGIRQVSFDGSLSDPAQIQSYEFWSFRMWQVASITARQEIETVSRINSAGFIAHVPTFVKKYRRASRGPVFFRVKTEPMFPTYIFTRPDAAFRKDIFEDSRTRLYFLPNGFVTDEQMTEINSMAMKLTLEGSRAVEPIVFKPGEAVQVLTAAMAGKQMKVLEVRRKGGKLLVEFVDRPGSYPFVIDSGSVAKVV